MNNKPKIIFYGGVGSTTGANILLKYEDSNIMVDCGLIQGDRKKEEENFKPFVFDPKKIDFLLVTHSHLDHIGRIPKLVKEGFRGKIISTEETLELSLPMLNDALNILKIKHPEKNMFDEKDITKTFSLWVGYKYYEKVKLSPDCFLEMINAGHILGSAILKVFCGQNEERKIISFTGDLGNSPSPLLPDNDLPKDSDYLVMESVYGDRNHISKEERRKKLKDAILEGIKRGGTIVIPAFSIERTQILLYEINNMVEDGEIPNIPVFLDSPLAQKITFIYKKHINQFKKSVLNEINSGDDIFDFPSLEIIERNTDSQSIYNTKDPKIIIAGSGMSEGGRVVNHEIKYLPDPKATIILAGYQSVGSLGRKIQDGNKEIVISNGGILEKIKVKARIVNIEGYSSHKDSDNLVDFIDKTNSKGTLKKVFVIMGETKSSLFLCQRIRDYLDIEAIYPEEGREYFLG